MLWYGAHVCRGAVIRVKLLSLATLDVRMYPSCHAKSCHVTNSGLVREHQKTSCLKSLVTETFVFYFHCSLVFTLSDSNHNFLTLSAGRMVPPTGVNIGTVGVVVRVSRLGSICCVMLKLQICSHRQVILIVVTLIIPITLLWSG